MATWPGALPQDQFIGLNDTRQPAVVRSQPDTGPAKMRRRFTAAPRFLTVPIVLDGSQRQTFDTFFITTIKEGSLTFDWEDPVDDTTVTFRFRTPPRFELVVGDSDVNKRVWRTNMELEILV